MPVRYDPPLISTLARELEERWRGEAVRSLRLAAPHREARLAFKSGDALVFLLHPRAGHLLAEAGSGPRGSPAGAPAGGLEIPFRHLRLAAVRALPDERVLELELAAEGRDPAFRLAVELQTNQWNAVLAHGRSGRVESVLWSRTAGGRTLRRGAAYVPPSSRRAWIADLPTPDQWFALLTPLPPGARRRKLLAGAAWLSPINVEWVLGEAAASPDAERLEEAYARYLRLRAAGDAAWLLSRKWGPQPYVLELDQTAEPARSLLHALARAACREGIRPAASARDDARGREERAEAEGGGTGTPDRAAEQAAELASVLEARAERTRRRKRALERQLEGPRPEALRTAAQLILARKGDIPRGAGRVTLAGFDGAPVQVELDPAASALDNAERYFGLARRRERALRDLPPRIRALEKRLTQIEAALDGLRTSGATEEVRRLASGLLPANSESSGPPGRTGRGRRPAEARALPYRRLRARSGREIRVGRSARGNDELTFRHSAPEDIWLHARQARGAHVILRWGKRDENPPQADLEDAAVAAAVYSDARHSGIVPVDWTRRKYVRKPRRSPPGTVIPDRTTTLFVPPDAARVRRMRTES